MKGPRIVGPSMQMTMTTVDNFGSSSSTAPAASRRPHDLIWVLAATMGVCTILLAWSIGTAPVLGDESYHFRRAVVYFEAPWRDFRAACDPAFPSEGPCAIRYWDAAFWHMGLALLWKALGTPSFLAAEAYHLAYMLMLGVFSFLAGRELYGRAGGWWTWALAMTMPINILLSTVFYLEIPVAAMAAMAVYCLLRQRAVWFGAALAGMFYPNLRSCASKSALAGAPGPFGGESFHYI